MRHHVSTLYAGIEMSETDRQLFYKHMGHSGAINENVYQATGAEAEIIKVGSNLTAMDGQNIQCCSIITAEAIVTVKATVIERSTSKTTITPSFIANERQSPTTMQFNNESSDSKFRFIFKAIITSSDPSENNKESIKQTEGVNICFYYHISQLKNTYYNKNIYY